MYVEDLCITERAADGMRTVSYKGFGTLSSVEYPIQADLSISQKSFVFNELSKPFHELFCLPGGFVGAI